MANQTQSAKSYQRWQQSKRDNNAINHIREQIQQEQIMEEIDGKQAIIDNALADGTKLSPMIVKILENAGYYVPEMVK